MNPEILREWWWRRQGLDESLDGTPPSAVLERAGWARSVGGCGPYLTLFSRAGTSREAADAAVAGLDIHELPAARCCTYVVPHADFTLALKAGEANSHNEARLATRLGATAAEVDRGCDAVLHALAEGPLDPDGIKRRAGDAIKFFGAEGQKKGLASTLPVALGILQSRGDIRRIPTNGRLDQQRYRYTLWRPNPLSKCKLSAEEVHVELARRFFRWIGPSTAAEFRTFSGLGVKAANLAMEPLKLEALDDRLAFSEDLDAIRSLEPDRNPQYALVSSLDSITLLRRDLRDLQGNFNEPPHHTILDRGRIVGWWEFDTESKSIAWLPFVKKNKQLEAAVRRTEQYIVDQLGDARAFSLDSPASRRKRIDALQCSA
jgi:hypothetical protein